MKKELMIFFIILGILVIASVLIIVYPSLFNPSSGSNAGANQNNQDNTLKVTITTQDGTVLSGIEVDLWTSGSTGEPNAGVATTNLEGIATFTLAQGNYEIGFNSNNFPSVLAYPQKTPVTVTQGSNEKIIALYSA